MLDFRKRLKKALSLFEGAFYLLELKHKSEKLKTKSEKLKTKSEK